MATELYSALQTHRDVDLHGALMRSSWRWTHLKTVPFLLRTLIQIRRMARRGEIDAVLFSSMVTASLAILLHKTLLSRGIPMAAIVHGRDVTLPFGPYQQLVPRIFDALDGVLPVSRATGVQCLERGLPEARLFVVPNGVDVRRFPPLGDFGDMRAALRTHFEDHPLPDDALLLCSVGRQVERKGFAWFIGEVMPRLPDEVHYWLAGEGPEEDNIRAAIARYGLERRVRLLGRISDEALSVLYRGADLFIMPNRPVPGDMEGFGVVMLEAGLSGLPAVAARLEGILDVITEGANGHLVETGDGPGFAAAILQYHRQPSQLQAAALRTARHTAETFGWPAVADHYVAVLQRLRFRVSGLEYRED